MGECGDGRGVVGGGSGAGGGLGGMGWGGEGEYEGGGKYGGSMGVAFPRCYECGAHGGEGGGNPDV